MELDAQTAALFVDENSFNEVLDGFLSQLRSVWTQKLDSKAHAELKRVQGILRLMKDSDDPSKRRMPTVKLMKRLLRYYKKILVRDETFFRENASNIAILRNVDLATKMGDTRVPPTVREGIWETMRQLLLMGCHCIINSSATDDPDDASLLRYDDTWPDQCRAIVDEMGGDKAMVSFVQAEEEEEQPEGPSAAVVDPQVVQTAALDLLRDLPELSNADADPEKREENARKLGEKAEAALALLPEGMRDFAMQAAMNVGENIHREMGPASEQPSEDDIQKAFMIAQRQLLAQAPMLMQQMQASTRGRRQVKGGGFAAPTGRGGRRRGGKRG